MCSFRYLLADVVPVIPRFLSKDFTKLFYSILRFAKSCVLPLTPISNATPPCEQNIEVLSLLPDDLKQEGKKIIAILSINHQK